MDRSVAVVLCARLLLLPLLVGGVLAGLAASGLFAADPLTRDVHALHTFCTSDVPRRHVIQPERMYPLNEKPRRNGALCPLPDHITDL